MEGYTLITQETEHSLPERGTRYVFTAKYDEIFQGEVFAEDEEIAHEKLLDIFKHAPGFQVINLNPEEEMSAEEFIKRREEVLTQERKQLN